MAGRTMATTRQHLNEAALHVAKLLSVITRMTDAEIDEITDRGEVEHLAEAARRVHEYAAEQKFDQTTKQTSINGEDQ